MELVQIFFTALGAMVVLFLLTKLMGNRQMSQLSMFDYINGITIGSIAAEMATSLENDFLKPLVAMAVCAGLSVVISLLSCKSIGFRRFMTGKPLILFNNGKIYNRNLFKAKMDTDDLLTQCRYNGYFNLSDLQTALLETNGQVSFLPKSAVRPLTPSDMNLTPAQDQLVSNVIMDGKVMTGNLKYTGNNEAWLKKQLNSQGIRNIKDVFLATCDHENNLSVYIKVDISSKRDIFN